MDLKRLSLDELTGVINLYPWFGAARKELCDRMIRMGGDDWGEEQFSDAAMYVPEPGRISGMLHSASREVYADKDISSVIKKYISDSREGAPHSEEATHADTGASVGRARVAGGDYFSQKEYEQVRKEGDSVFSRFAARAKQEMTHEERRAHEEMEFCTETLAQIYAEQGYYEHAIHIYEKLILAYPEKNAYFAALIEKLRTED